jgi:predicted nucleic acid-binding protein
LELASVFWQRILKGELDQGDAKTALRRSARIPRLFSDASLSVAAMDLAVAHDLSVYDATYVALAIKQDCQLVTGDRRLIEKLRLPLPGVLVWIGEIDVEPTAGS